MIKETLTCVLNQIHRWRQEAGIEKKIDERSFKEALEEISKRDVPEALTAHVVLGCEWLLRVKKVDNEDVERGLSEIQKAFGEFMRPELAYLVRETLAQGIEERMKKEGRTLASLGPYSEHVPLLLRYGGFKPEEAKTPYQEPVVLTRPGPIPLYAPWIASVVMERILKKSADNTGLALELVAAMLGRKSPIEQTEFGKVRRRLEGDALDRLVQELKGGYLWLLASGTLNWEKVLQENLANISPIEVFPSDQNLVRKLLDSYGSSEDDLVG